MTNHSKEVTKRFLIAFDKITGDRSKGKITQQMLGEQLGISSTNVNRLRTSPTHNVTLEACCQICKLYNVSPAWLLMGKEEAANDTEKRLISLEKQVADIAKKLGRTKKV